LITKSHHKIGRVNEPFPSAEQAARYVTSYFFPKYPQFVLALATGQHSLAFVLAYFDSLSYQ